MNIKKLLSKLDLTIIIIPVAVVILLFTLFVTKPQEATLVLNNIRAFISDTLGSYYLILGLGFFLLTLLIAFSKYGKIRLGKEKNPVYSNFKWGSMIFTSTLAADVLFYSLSEWAMYANESHVKDLGAIQDWASTFPLFHWGPIAWGIYVVLAIAFAFMIHIKGQNKQRFSEACRPLFGKKVDGPIGKTIDLICIIALLCGTATTFSVTTPLLSAAISKVFGLPNSIILVISILVLIALTYTITVLFGIKGISKLATFCVYLFLVLLAYVFVAGGKSIYIVETGISGIGNMLQNFVGLATYTDPLRENSFPQNWTMYYWAYWMAWCVATPFFIATISKGRTIKNMILGCYTYGLSGTFLSFIILGGFGLGQQTANGTGLADVIYKEDFSVNYESILSLFDALPLSDYVLILFVISMILFYSTTFDTITMVVSNYSYKHITSDDTAGKPLRAFWSVIFILFPIALLFSEKSIASLQSVSIIAAFPIGVIIVMVLLSFFKDAKKYLQSINYKDDIIEMPDNNS